MRRGYRTCFNSKMVRLKGGNLYSTNLKLYAFQFQNGAIKRVAFCFF